MENDRIGYSVTRSSLVKTPSYYEEVYNFVKRLFTTHENNFMRMAKDINKFLFINCGLDIDRSEKCVLSTRFNGMDLYYAHLIVVNKEHKMEKEKIMFKTFLSSDGGVHLIVIIPEKYIMTNMNEIERFHGFKFIFGYFMQLIKIKFPISSSLYTDFLNFVGTDAPFHMAAQLMIDLNLCDTSDLPEIISNVIVDWEKVFKFDLFDRLIYQMDFKLFEKDEDSEEK